MPFRSDGQPDRMRRVLGFLVAMTTGQRVLVLGTGLFIASLFIGDDAFDVQLYDTYFVVGWRLLLRVAGAVCLLLAIVYILRNRRSHYE